MNKKTIGRIESERIRNLPVYMFQEINTRKMKLRRDGKDIIDLGMGNPDRPTPKPVIDKLSEVACDNKTHRYSASKGIAHLRMEICRWYEKRFGVILDPEEEVVVCIGSKEGISHLALAIFDKGDTVMVPNPTYPSHLYSVAISGAKIYNMPITKENGFIPDLPQKICEGPKKPKAVILSYPNNPTTRVADMDFFERVVKFAKKNNLIVIHDNAYSELCFDGYRAPSFLQAKGAKDTGIEFHSLSKTYNMAGWRVGFAVGNKHVIKALTKLKSYYDYGMFTPIQVAAITALRLEQKYIDEVADTYRSRRNVFVDGLNRIGWNVEKPRATMYLWTEIPGKYRKMGSMDFSVFLLEKAGVAVSPGIGFGKYGEGYLRMALVENEQRLRQVVRSLKNVL
jgi:alanine-synthesizing transaminase